MKAADLLDNAPKAIGLLTFTILLMTILHDWGYFWFVGSRFLSIQTPYDHLANSIEWLPLNLSFIVVTFALGRLLVTRPDLEFQAQFHDARRRLVRRSLTKLGIAVMTAGAIAFAISFFVVPANNTFTFVATIALLIEGASVLTMAFMQKRPSWLRKSVLAVPQLVLMSFASGNIEASSDLASTHNVYQITAKGGAPSAVTLLRNFDKGPIVWDQGTQRATFYRWDQVESLAHHVDTTRHAESMGCNYLHILCFMETVEP